MSAVFASRTILVIDDSEAVRTAFDVLLSLHGARVLTMATPAQGLATLASDNVDLVIQDMNFRREATSGAEGIALFHEIRAHQLDCGLEVCPGGEQHDRHLRKARADLVKERDTLLTARGFAPEVHVLDHEVDSRAREHCQPCRR